MARADTRMCPRYQAAAELLGKRWTGLILKVLLDGPARFGELADRLEVVGDRMLSERLKELEAERVVERRVSPTRPVRIEYDLTDKGRALAPIVDAITAWAERWLPAPRGSPAPRAPERPARAPKRSARR